ncbi:MAG: universal stress protein [Chloroflexota bacterium]
MYNKILVPLDHSELAECVLPHVSSIAKGCGANHVVLISVIEPVHLPSGTISDGGDIFTEQDAERIRKQTDAVHRKMAMEYLEGVQQKQLAGINTEVQVLDGKASEAIAEYATKNGADLIIIATHGRSGISRWVWGSVADRVLRTACVPVMMVRPPQCVPGI